MAAVFPKVFRAIKDFPAGGLGRDFQSPITFSGDKTSKNVKRKSWK
jgi:hypothetical protein